MAECHLRPIDGIPGLILLCGTWSPHFSGFQSPIAIWKTLESSLVFLSKVGYMVYKLDIYSPSNGHHQIFPKSVLKNTGVGANLHPPSPGLRSFPRYIAPLLITKHQPRCVSNKNARTPRINDRDKLKAIDPFFFHAIELSLFVCQPKTRRKSPPRNHDITSTQRIRY